MSAIAVKITVSRPTGADALQALRNGMADRRQLHAALATGAIYGRDGEKGGISNFLAQSARHATAERLGAKPTGFHERAAKVLESESDEDEGRVLIPRNTGLGRAFHDVVLKPGSGKTYLTIPACAETYGRGVRDFPEGTFNFAVHEARAPVLRWAENGGSHFKGAVAYWLRREVMQKQDRDLLPSDRAIGFWAARGVEDYLTKLSKQA